MTTFPIALNPLGGIASSTIEGGIDYCYSNTGVRFLVLSPLFALLRLYRVGGSGSRELAFCPVRFVR